VVKKIVSAQQNILQRRGLLKHVLPSVERARAVVVTWKSIAHRRGLVLRIDLISGVQSAG
jgi:hypothetical protein